MVGAGGLPVVPARSSNRRMPATRRRKLRVGVLPFLITDESRDGNLARAANDSLAFALQEFHSVEVVRAESSLSDATGHRADPEAGRVDLVEYMVEGAVFSERGIAQLTVRLVDLGDCARTLFSKRFAIPTGKLAHWSQGVAWHIVAGIDPVKWFSDGRPQRRPRNGANELLLAAIPLISSMERRKFEDAGRLIDRALEFEPDNALAAALAAFWQTLYFGQGWTQNFTKASAIAEVRARTAISLCPDDSQTLAMCGHVIRFPGN
jgi:TolB-like protein